MENTEIAVQEQKYELSSGTFATTENFKEIFDIGKMFASSTLVPQAYQGKPMDCTIAVDMANRIGVTPMFVMQNLYVVKGKPSWSGQACMSMIKAAPGYKNVRPVYFGEPNTDSWGCYVRAEDRNTGEIINGAKVTIQMAKDEGWYSKKDKYGNETSKWQTMPELMLAYRASAFFAKVYIPNALMGAYVEGEVEDISKLARTATDEPLLSVPESVKQEAEGIFK